MDSVDLEKAVNRVAREVVWWALRYLGVDEWIVSVISGCDNNSVDNKCQ